MPADAQPGEPHGDVTLDLFGDELALAPVAESAVSREPSEPEGGLKAEAPQTETVQTAMAPEVPQADEQVPDAVPSQPEVMAVQEESAPSHEPAPDLRSAADEPTSAPSYPDDWPDAPTSATADAAPVVPVVHAADVEAVVRGPVPERAVAAMPAELVATMAAQARKTKWMLTAALAALVVTAGVAIAQTILLANLSADSQAQQQRIEVLMQNQQTALDSVSARLAAPAVVAVPAPEVAATNAVRATASATPPHHAAHVAKAPKSSEKATARTSGNAQSKAHAQQAARQAAAKS